MRGRTVIGAVVLVAVVVGYLVANSPGFRDELGAAATSVARPVVVPLVELINVPAFVYCAALVILLAGLVACGAYRFQSVGPRLAELRAIRREMGNLPRPRLQGAVEANAWPAARHDLGMLLQRNPVFVTPWATFQAESVRTRGVPQRPFSSFVAGEPQPNAPGEDLMQSLPGYFTSVGLIFTFVGLVVALYFAAKGFRTGDMGEARAAIIQLLNAASFKFLTSVAALISAFIVSVYGRYADGLVAEQRLRALEAVEIFLADWREKVGGGRAEQRLEPADLLRRFDALLKGVEALSADMRRLVDRGASADPSDEGAVDVAR